MYCKIYIDSNSYSNDQSQNSNKSQSQLYNFNKADDFFKMSNKSSSSSSFKSQPNQNSVNAKKLNDEIQESIKSKQESLKSSYNSKDKDQDTFDRNNEVVNPIISANNIKHTTDQHQITFSQLTQGNSGQRYFPANKEQEQQKETAGFNKKDLAHKTHRSQQRRPLVSKKLNNVFTHTSKKPIIK